MAYRKKEDIVARSIAGEDLLIPIRGKLADMQRIFSLNPVAEFVWKQLDEAQDVESLSNSVVEEFEVCGADAQRDVKAFLNDLVNADLVVEAPG